MPETKAEYLKRVTKEFQNGRDPDDMDLDNPESDDGDDPDDVS